MYQFSSNGKKMLLLSCFDGKTGQAQKVGNAQKA